MDLPYAVSGAKEVGFELHPARKGASCRVLDVWAAPQAQPATVGLRLAYARVAAPGPGELVFSLPWHPFWRAEVDGVEARACRGACGGGAVCRLRHNDQAGPKMEASAGLALATRARPHEPQCRRGWRQS